MMQLEEFKTYATNISCQQISENKSETKGNKIKTIFKLRINLYSNWTGRRAFPYFDSSVRIWKLVSSTYLFGTLRKVKRRRRDFLAERQCSTNYSSGTRRSSIQLLFCSVVLLKLSKSK